MNEKILTKKQSAVIDELFKGELSEEQICEKYAVAPAKYRKWLSDEIFIKEFSRRIEWLNLQSQALIARYSSLAAAKLVELIDSEKDETRRKACLDVLSLGKENDKKNQNQQINSQDSQSEASTEISAETASRLLSVLAEEK
ncbi:MAG: hypothetical protein WCZ89_01465 [Phycisphaerae bacterium]